MNNISNKEPSSLLPSCYPDRNITSQYISDQDYEYLSHKDKVIISWSIALATAMEKQQLWRKIPGFRFATYGFSQPKIEDFSFGVIINACPMPGTNDEVLSLKCNNEIFPVFIRRSFVILQASPSINPLRGAACCWVKSNRTSERNGEGFLTARHVLPDNLIAGQYGSYVDLDKGKEIGKVIDLCFDGLDSALVAPDNNSLFAPGNKIETLKHIAAWTDVTVHGLVSGNIQTKITSVGDLRGLYTSWLQPIRLMLNDYGQPGDSGSIVTDNNGKGVGMYTGKVNDWRGLTEGIAVLLAQIEYNMDIELFD